MEPSITRASAFTTGGQALLALMFGVFAACAETNGDAQAIKRLIGAYAQSIDRAGTRLAEQIFSDAPEVMFIHPRGEERGRARIQTNFCQDLMEGTFSERKLTPKEPPRRKRKGRIHRIL